VGARRVSGSSVPVGCDLRLCANDALSADGAGMTKRRLRHRRVTAVTVGLAFCTAFGVIVGFRVGGVASTRLFDDIATPVAAAGASTMCVLASGRGPRSHRRYWLLMAAACVAWTVAEVLWAIYDVVMSEPVPVPSWADVGYLGAIPLCVGAFLNHPAMRSRTAKRLTATIDGLLVANAVLLLSWMFVLGPLWSRTDLSTSGGIVAVSYPFGDVVLVVLVVMIVRATRGIPFSFSGVLVGLLAMAASDSAYTFLTETNNYSTGNLVDVGWVVAYTAIGVGAFCASPADDAVRLEPAQGSRTPISVFAPYAVMVAALCALSADLQIRHHVGAVEWLMALVLVLLVLARHFATGIRDVARRSATSRLVSPPLGSRGT
jgi:hypothetical protein